MSPRSVRPSLSTAAAASVWDVTIATVEHMTAVVALAKSESNRVGFIPTGGLAQYVSSGWCFVARESSGDVAGYLLGRPSLRYARWCRPVTQLVVRTDLRRRGVARALIGALSTIAAADGRDCLQAWSRADLAANHLWEALGWAMVAERSPKSARRRPSLLWRYPLTPAGLQLLVKIPPVGGYRAGKQLTQGLFADWKTRGA